ncbi:hypothetical protein, partial [Rathayibacter rathayi]|uniref:hypothetical protein n=1 Tax=Rathayibacter rathayi TaxID=33887 RepID=UPI001CA5A918
LDPFGEDRVVLGRHSRSRLCAHRLVPLRRVSVKGCSSIKADQPVLVLTDTRKSISINRILHKPHFCQ